MRHLLTITTSILLFAAGCAAVDATTPEGSPGGKADDGALGRLRCGQVVRGTVDAWDQGPLVDFSSASGGEVTLSFSADYAPRLGAVLQVFESFTGEPTAKRVERSSSRATLVLQARAGVEYTVVAYAFSASAEGSYELRADCPSSPPGA